MKHPEALRRRRDAGLRLVTACEQALGVTGPSALARLTGRSKSWWSKLAAGAAAFPTWEELEELLPSGTAEAERERLRHDHRRAWLGLYEPELLQRLDSPVPVGASLEDLQALLNTADALGYQQEEQRTALRLLKILELLLLARDIQAMSREGLEILRECLDHQSVCEGQLGNPATSIAIARRSVAYQRAGGSRLGELLARHALGIALRHPLGCRARAVAEFEALQKAYARLGMVPELVRARRDGAATRIDMGHRKEGEAELLVTYEIPRQSGENQYLTAACLAHAALRRGDVPQARRWLAQMRVITRRHPDEIALLLKRQFVLKHVTHLERWAAEPPPRRH